MRFALPALLLITACSPFSAGDPTSSAPALDAGAGADSGSSVSADGGNGGDAAPSPPGSLCASQPGKVYFCDDFEGGGSALSGTSCSYAGWALGVVPDGAQNHVLQTKGTLTQGTSYNCWSWIDLMSSDPSGNGVVVEFKFRLATFTATYAVLAGFIVDNAQSYGLAAYKGPLLTNVPPPGSNTAPNVTVSDMGGWHTAKIILRATGNTVTQATTIDNVVLPEISPSQSFSGLSFKFGAFYTGGQGGELDVAIDDLVIRAN